MANNIFEGQVFKSIDYTKQAIERGEYDDCIFSNCNFLESNLSHIIFSNCTFEHCDLSMIKPIDTAFRDVTFSNCKMLGIRFEGCNPFGLVVAFDGCTLNYASFYKLKLKQTVFNKCNIVEGDFTETDLTQSKFIETDLRGTVFDRSNLEKADLSTAHNFLIDPATNRIKKARFSARNIAGLLYKHDITIED